MKFPIQNNIPYYWFLFPPCEGCTVLKRRFRPFFVIRKRRSHVKKIKTSSEKRRWFFSVNFPLSGETILRDKEEILWTRKKRKQTACAERWRKRRRIYLFLCRQCCVLYRMHRTDSNTADKWAGSAGLHRYLCNTRTFSEQGLPKIEAERKKLSVPGTLWVGSRTFYFLKFFEKSSVLFSKHAVLLPITVRKFATK